MEPQTTPSVAPSVAESIMPAAYSSNPLDLVKPSWEAFKRCWLNLILLILSLIGIIGIAIILGLVMLPTPFGLLVDLVLIFPALFYIGSYFSWASTKLLISASRGEKLSFKAALPPSLGLPLKYLATSFLAGLIILGGYILLIVPGFIFTARYSSAVFVAVDEGIWGMAAVRRSRELTRGRNWDVLGALTLPAVFSILSLIPILGPLVNFVISMILAPLFAVRYVQLVELKKQPNWQTVPTNPWNYAVLIIALLIGGINTVHGIITATQSASLEKSSQSY